MFINLKSQKKEISSLTLEIKQINETTVDLSKIEDIAPGDEELNFIAKVNLV